MGIKTAPRILASKLVGWCHLLRIDGQEEKQAFVGRHRGGEDENEVFCFGC